MATYTVELKDVTGASCRVNLSLPFLKNGTDPTNSAWRIFDSNFLRINWGGCHMVDTTPGDTFTYGNLHLCHGDAFGVDLHQFVDSLGLANDSGSGVVYQGWAGNCKPGQISWALVK